MRLLIATATAFVFLNSVHCASPYLDLRNQREISENRNEASRRDLLKKISHTKSSNGSTSSHVCIYEGSQRDLEYENVATTPSTSINTLQNSTILRPKKVIYSKTISLQSLITTESISDLGKTNSFTYKEFPNADIIIDNDLAKEMKWPLNRNLEDVAKDYPNGAKFEQAEKMLIDHFGLCRGYLGHIAKLGGNQLVFKPNEITAKTSVREVLSRMLSFSNKVSNSQYCFQIFPGLCPSNGSDMSWGVIAFD